MSAAGILFKRGGALFGSSQSMSALASTSYATRTITSLDSSSYSSSSSSSSNGKRLFDTHALVRRLEAQGVPSKHAEAFVSAFTEISSNTLEMQKNEMMQGVDLSMFKSQMQSSQEHLSSIMNMEIQKIVSDMEHLSSIMNMEIQKIVSDMVKLHGEAKLETQVEIEKVRGELKWQLEEWKHLSLKFFFVTLISATGVAFALLQNFNLLGVKK